MSPLRRMIVTRVIVNQSITVGVSALGRRASGPADAWRRTAHLSRLHYAAYAAKLAA